MSLTKAWIGAPSGWRSRWLEHTPWKTPRPERAGPSTTATVILQRRGSWSGDEEIE